MIINETEQKEVIGTTKERVFGSRTIFGKRFHGDRKWRKCKEITLNH